MTYSNFLAWKFQRKLFWLFWHTVFFTRLCFLWPSGTNSMYQSSRKWMVQKKLCLAKPRKERFRNRQSPIETEIWIGTKWLSVLSPPHRMNTILYPKCHWSLNSIHYSGYSFMNMTFFLKFKLYKNKINVKACYYYTYEGMSQYNCEGMSN